MAKVQRRVTMYHESLVTKTNLTGAKTYNEGDEPSMEDGWSNRPIPAKPAVEIEAPPAVDMKKELAIAYNKGVADAEGKIDEAMRLGKASAENEFLEQIIQLEKDVELAHDTGFNKGVVEGKKSKKGKK